MKTIVFIISLCCSIMTSAQPTKIDYYKILQLDTIPSCRNRNSSEKTFTDCYLKYFGLMSDRWFNGYSGTNRTYGHSIWFYGDCEDQKNFTFDSVAVNIHYHLPKYYSKSYMFTPAEAEAFFMKKKKK